MNGIQTGDHVRLKGDTQIMKVLQIEGDQALCVFIATDKSKDGTEKPTGAEPDEAYFELNALEKSAQENIWLKHYK